MTLLMRAYESDRQDAETKLQCLYREAISSRTCCLQGAALLDKEGAEAFAALLYMLRGANAAGISAARCRAMTPAVLLSIHKARTRLQSLRIRIGQIRIQPNERITSALSAPVHNTTGSRCSIGRSAAANRISA